MKDALARYPQAGAIEFCDIDGRPRGFGVVRHSDGPWMRLRIWLDGKECTRFERIRWLFYKYRRALREAILLPLLGSRYPGNHDYTSLRTRYSCFRWRGGVDYAWRVGRLAITLEMPGFRVALRDARKCNRPLWDTTDWRWPFDWH